MANGATLYPESTIESVLQASNFKDFHSNMEFGPHGSVVHVSIGGDMGQMHSPNDLIFYFHHRNVDRYWSNWQNQNPQNKYDYSGQANEMLDFLGLISKVPVAETFDLLSGGAGGLYLLPISKPWSSKHSCFNHCQKRLDERHHHS